MSLWRSCFEDTEEFIELYFSRVYTDENTLIGYAPDKVTAVCHTQALPYKLQLAKGTVPLPVGYISGACTLIEYRGQGYMQRLMEKALEMMYERGDVASFLIPASESLFHFYQKGFGYGTAFYYEEAHEFNFEPILAELSTSDVAMTLTQHERNMQSYGILHDDNQWQTIILDYNLGVQSQVTNLYDTNGHIDGLALYIDFGDCISVRCCYASIERREELLSTINPQSKPYRQVLPVSSSDITSWIPKGMLRPIRLYDLLKEWIREIPDYSCHVYIVDDLLQHNTGSYNICNGTITYTKAQEQDAVFMEISTLVEEIARRRPLFMSFMLE